LYRVIKLAFGDISILFSSKHKRLIQEIYLVHPFGPFHLYQLSIVSSEPNIKYLYIDYCELNTTYSQILWENTASRELHILDIKSNQVGLSTPIF
jgi:hypothetical protein